MTTATDDITGEQLAETLLLDVADGRMRAATRLLGAHRDGYWLRRFAEDQELAEAADRPLIDRSGRHPNVDWDSVGFLLTALVSPAVRSTASEVVVLEFAAALVDRCRIRLRDVLNALDAADLKRAAQALHEAGDGRLR
ncbi:hypothetical protein ACFWR9_20485 [Streptomyces sp. NPDC058534]|uniref:hypothetical protein n=1 Tax=Streptomyces sp. NPDC058534 TaxID=3346541 RepID=UPI00366824F5